jgi:hypothetical protein
MSRARKTMLLADWAGMGFVACPECGALHKPGGHPPESCATLQKFTAMRRAMIENGLWDSDDRSAVDDFLRKFDQ